MKKKMKISWLAELAENDYSAAEAYLQLMTDKKKAHSLTKKLKRTRLSEYFAKDILRASETPMAEVQAFDWVKQNNEINAGTPLSPILLVRDVSGRRLIVADGFHRLCAVFAVDQEALIPCKLA